MEIAEFITISSAAITVIGCTNQVVLFLKKQA
ncbi:hypothetical protein HNQ88_004289 [Aureibacter tunicatorum]|uniref:Uncharacterized protein n=1 Tax=Aureibacter tunicatorum TaxID=866807 RepID=A0AAE4BTY1_9BACT|nr:hypothetical protein [Aureibacter tunicatorum]BDD03472.1 hypothetical protein AUTU_09550 [Aureibacter tunicatorum]